MSTFKNPYTFFSFSFDTTVSASLSVAGFDSRPTCSGRLSLHSGGLQLLSKVL